MVHEALYADAAKTDGHYGNGSADQNRIGAEREHTKDIRT